jgi:glutamyl-tRNA synthetase
MLSEEVRRRLVPSVDSTPTDIEARYPARPLAAGAEVTRFGPSPTGYVHIGSMLVALIAEAVARESEGVFLLRIEDTDRSRLVDDAVVQLKRALEYFHIAPDEDITKGDYGPYRQSERGDIYDVYVAALLARDQAYPCFCTPEELSELTARQRAAEVPTGYWGRWARCRTLSPDEVQRRLDNGDSYVIRFKAPEFTGKRIKYVDVIRGALEIEDNRNDVVIRKSMGLPTYHMAHPIDDHLMRVTTVIRADEWLSSVPLHLQLFNALDFPAPRYAHIAPIMMMEGKSKRKLSKRKDPEANVDYYSSAGYPAEGLLSYLRGLANSRLQDRPVAEVLAAPIHLDECSVSGQLLDLPKLDQICRDFIAELDYAEIADRLETWSNDYDEVLAGYLREDRQSVVNALAIEGTAAGKPRKDLARWSDFGEKYAFLLPQAFALVTDAADARFAPLEPDLVRRTARAVAENYQHDGDSAKWFDQVRRVGIDLGFAPTVGEYKRNPDQFRGPIKEAANVIRVLLTGSTRSPDLYETTRVLGASEVMRRLTALQ